MTLSSIFDLCVPREDVLKGAVTEADFAADLAQVIRGKGPDEYVKSAPFFANTYPTRGLRDLLANVCARLSGAGGEAAAIFRLDTSYGGGKTHGLIALVHAARGMTGVPNIHEFVNPAILPKGRVRIAAFDGENADPANGRRMEGDILAFTPWGEIACALAGKAGYERVRSSDEQMVAPGAETLQELFGGEPSLILLDELSVYLRKVANRPQARDQLTAFLTSLFKAIEASPNAALVYTLAIGKEGAVDAYSDENQFIADRMAEAESVSARKASRGNIGTLRGEGPQAFEEGHKAVGIGLVTLAKPGLGGLVQEVQALALHQQRSAEIEGEAADGPLRYAGQPCEHRDRHQRAQDREPTADFIDLLRLKRPDLIAQTRNRPFEQLADRRLHRGGCRAELLEYLQQRQALGHGQRLHPRV